MRRQLSRCDSRQRYCVMRVHNDLRAKAGVMRLTEYLRTFAVAVRCSGSPASDVAERIDVTPWYGGLLQSEPISIFGIFGADFSAFVGFSAIRFLYALFSQLFALPANSGYFSKSRFSVNIRKSAGISP